MIVTRTWLEEFIDLEGIGDDRLYEIFNSIGLEVDSIKQYVLPDNVVVGRVLSCEKHPDADKLNVCQVEVGGETLQIVCGAANVVEAEFVAVAKVGAVLPGDFAIRPAKLRGVESYGMICSAAELGLPETGEGILILDESIGEPVPGREVGSYPRIGDTVIELELTANRGDCLSVLGVARDLAAALDREIRPFQYRAHQSIRKGIARTLELHCRGDIEVDLAYMLMEAETLKSSCLLQLRLAFVDEYRERPLEAALAYTTHATGVILRIYDADRLKEGEEKISLEIVEQEKGDVEILGATGLLSTVGISQNPESAAIRDEGNILVEASYIDPDFLVPYVAKSRPRTDRLYYRSSRGSDPDLGRGLMYFMACCDSLGKCSFSENPLKVEAAREERVISVDVSRLNAVIGQEISKGTVHTILKKLGFAIHKNSSSDVFGARVPVWRHDIRHIQDIAEEVLRIVGINNIQARPLQLTEANRLTEEARRYRIRRDLRQRAAGVGFYEAVTYAFAEKKKLLRYGFPVTTKEAELVNPIVEELNTLRSTLTVNLLEAARRNVSYGKKRIPLFEIGSVFDRERNETEKAAFLWSGETEEASVLNQGKPSAVDFPSFARFLAAVIGPFRLSALKPENSLIHPYQSATVWIGDKEAGWMGKLHPEAAEDFGLEETFVAELDFDILMPPHRNAEAVSNFQGVYKDLSLLVDRALPYEKMEEIVEKIDEPLLRRFFPIDRYEDSALGDAKSMTLRFFLQSEEGTLSDEEIERVMKKILSAMETGCGARLR